MDKVFLRETKLEPRDWVLEPENGKKLTKWKKLTKYGLGTWSSGTE